MAWYTTQMARLKEHGVQWARKVRIPLRSQPLESFSAKRLVRGLPEQEGYGGYHVTVALEKPGHRCASVTTFVFHVADLESIVAFLELGRRPTREEGCLRP